MRFATSSRPRRTRTSTYVARSSRPRQLDRAPDLVTRATVGYPGRMPTLKLSTLLFGSFAFVALAHCGGATFGTAGPDQDGGIDASQTGGTTTPAGGAGATTNSTAMSSSTFHLRASATPTTGTGGGTGAPHP